MPSEPTDERHRRLLSPPEAEHIQFEKNLITQAICEARFPTLLDLEDELPVAFNRALRREYPIYQRNANLTVRGTEAKQQARHVFKSKDGRWTLGLHSSAIALDTQAYNSFEEFHGRFMKILELVAPLLDTDFFTRLGLRYINVLPDVESLAGWVNDALIASLVSGVLGDPEVYWQEIRGRCTSGQYSLRHGLELDPKPGQRQRYVLDLDFYDENVEADGIGLALNRFHDEGYRLFSWTIGAETRRFMRARPASPGSRP